MNQSNTCGVAIWGMGSITRPPLGHCALPRGHGGAHDLVAPLEATPNKPLPPQRQLDIDFTCPYDKWKSCRDISVGDLLPQDLIEDSM